MTTETTTTTTGATGEEKINQLRELFADAPEVGKKALENVLGQLTSQASQKRPPPVQSAGRVGSRWARSRSSPSSPTARVSRAPPLA